MRIVFAGGGTAGHIIPFRAVIEAVRDQKPDTDILYICSDWDNEKKFLKDLNIRYAQIKSGKFRRYFSLSNLFSPLLVIMGFFQSLRILSRFKPTVVFI